GIANLIYTIFEENEEDTTRGEIETAPVVDIVTEVVDDEEMPTVEIDVSGESPAEQPVKYNIIPSEDSDESGDEPDTSDTML
ncbi:MAG: hypothetical protein ACKPKO_01335, partial [Candidatus Fonsibacter sp.]